MQTPPALLGRSDLVPLLKNAYSCRGEWKSRLPLVYCEEYNVRVYGIEKLHPLDACKFGKIVALLESSGLCRRSELPSPTAISDDALLDVHTDVYVKKVQTNKLYICQILELPLAFLVPKFLIERCLIRPLRFHTGGTILAMALAIERGWAINIGGGAHHARRDHGEGWCFFADITLGIRKLRQATNNQVQRVLYIDCDVHQGNGVEHDKQHFNDSNLYILDVYNTDIWPQDHRAKESIDLSVKLHIGTKDQQYLEKLKMALAQVRSDFQPDLIVYNAGTDILDGDALGRLCVSPQGVVQRDEVVFQHAVDVKAPIVMLLSGGKKFHLIEKSANYS